MKTGKAALAVAAGVVLTACLCGCRTTPKRSAEETRDLAGKPLRIKETRTVQSGCQEWVSYARNLQARLDQCLEAGSNDK